MFETPEKNFERKPREVILLVPEKCITLMSLEWHNISNYPRLDCLFSMLTRKTPDTEFSWRRVQYYRFYSNKDKRNCFYPHYHINVLILLLFLENMSPNSWITRAFSPAHHKNVFIVHNPLQSRPSYRHSYRRSFVTVKSAAITVTVDWVEHQTDPETITNAWWRHQMETFSVLLAICAEFADHRWNPRTKASDTEL